MTCIGDELGYNAGSESPYPADLREVRALITEPCEPWRDGYETICYYCEREM